MKRFFWMVLIFTFLFSLTALFAQQNATEAKVAEKTLVKTEVKIEKASKKVSEIPKVHIRNNSEIAKATQNKSEVSSNKKQVHLNASQKKAEPVLNKRPKAYPVNANKSD